MQRLNKRSSMYAFLVNDHIEKSNYFHTYINTNWLFVTYFQECVIYQCEICVYKEKFSTMMFNWEFYKKKEKKKGYAWQEI